MTTGGPGPGHAARPEHRTPEAQPLSVVDGDLEWPPTPMPEEHLSLVEDVAARFAGLPVEHVMRALRRELSGLAVDGELIQTLGRRIASGQLPIG